MIGRRRGSSAAWNRTWRDWRERISSPRQASTVPVANTSTTAVGGRERRTVPNSWNNRLAVLGARSQVQRFQKSNWNTVLCTRHCELLENSPCRFACEFETERSLPEPLRKLARRWPRLTFLLDFESEAVRIKGLAKA